QKFQHINNRPSQTKIIATIGPASGNRQILKEMFLAGIDACRLNFSHGSQSIHKETINMVNDINSELNTHVAIIADLQGPKLRIGEIENGQVEIKQDHILTITQHEMVGNADKVYLNYDRLPKDAQPGDIILIDDGRLRVRVEKSNAKDEVVTRVLNGGVLSSRKGVNLPDTRLTLPSLTGKDHLDAVFALEQGVDWIALSFVRSVDDILNLKKLIRKTRPDNKTGVIAKIEKPEALDEIDEIIDVSDGIMIARGDLGVEVPFDRVPLIQKQIVNKAIYLYKPVIIATQMMESQIENFNPTRAEANDVANAVLDGSDVLMLSGETSVGKYPVQVIKNMQKIIDWTESNGFDFYLEKKPVNNTARFLPDSICFSAVNLAKQTDAKAIIVFTHSGNTAYKVSSYRPAADIFAITPNKAIIRKLSLLWGVRAFYNDEEPDIEMAIQQSIEFLKKQDLISEGEVVIHVGSSPVSKRGKTNLIRINYV
ncbi:MAG: pyruvate kinase, partial [Bacteroidota bacterium]